MTPPKFNQKFNQSFNENSTSKHSGAENFSCFTTLWEEGPTELADYYSDEEEDDCLDNEDTWSERDTWEKFEASDKEDTWSKANQNEPEFETHHEIDHEEPGDRNTCTNISSLSVETAQAFSAWQLYIPPNHAFQSASAQSWWSDFSPQASLSQEPTLTQISVIKNQETTIEPTPAPMKTIPAKRITRRLPPQGWHPSKLAMKNYTHIWNRPWPELIKTYNETRNSLNKSPGHPEQSRPFRHWKQSTPCSIETTRTQNTKFQTMPPETDAGDAYPVFTPRPSRTYSRMTSRNSTTKIRSLETKWRRSSNKIQTSRTKFPRPCRHLQKNSRRTPSWLWLPRRWPPTCSSSTTTGIKKIPKQRISPHGRNHFSKRRSESKSYINKSENKHSKSKSESETKI
jgi:hypothetical protein